MNKIKMRYPALITLVCTIAMLIMIFLPFTSATNKYEKKLMEHEDKMYVEEINMTYKDAVDISLFEYIRVFVEAINQGIREETAIASLIPIVLFIVFAVITLLLSIFRKPIGIMVLDILMMGVFRLVCFDFEDRGVVPSSSYDWGIAMYLVYVIGVMIFAGAIWLLIAKKKSKKDSNNS